MWTNLFYIYTILVLQILKLMLPYFSIISLDADAEYHVEQSSQNSSPDGSKNTSFASLNQAVTFLQSRDFDLILQGTLL